MKKHKDPNYVVKVEKAISKKYGEDTIQNPRGNWNDEKEQDFIEQSKLLYKKELINEEKEEKIEQNGFLATRKLLSKEAVKENCPVCKNYSLNPRDSVYVIKFDCCFGCYVKYVEGRKERWKSGWRPKKENE